MAITIAIASLKGGTGKTSVSTNLSLCLAKYGRVLLIDADPQGNASLTLGTVHPMEQPSGMVDLLNSKAIIHDVTQPTQFSGIDIVPNNTQTISVLKSLNDIEGNMVLQAKMDAQTQDTYEFILIDCPPSLDGSPLISSLIAADWVLYIIDDLYALQGLNDLRNTVDTVNTKFKQPILNTKTAEMGILFNRQDRRTRAFKNLREDTMAIYWKEFLLESCIPQTTEMRESQQKKKLVCEKSASGLESSICKAFTAVAGEIVAKTHEGV